MYPANFIKKTERSDSILRNSAVGYSAVLRFAFQLCKVSDGMVVNQRRLDGQGNHETLNL
jgi:hypothetical protein